jgi:hypothetical protein
MMVSKDGGTTPLWRHDGKELFYLGADGKRFIMAAPSATSERIQPRFKFVLNWSSLLKK